MIEVDPETGCWIWQGIKSKGYGVLTYNIKTYPGIKIGRTASFGKNRNKNQWWRAIMSHQFFYFLAHGNPPPDTELGHVPECSRRSCCNPDHVRPITAQQNKAEMYSVPKLSREVRDTIEQYLLEDRSCNWIADQFQISVWSVRRISNEIDWRNQQELFDEEPPF